MSRSIASVGTFFAFNYFSKVSEVLGGLSQGDGRSTNKTATFRCSADVKTDTGLMLKKRLTMERVKVVVRYAAGDLIKGFTQDFFPNKESFHVFPEGQSPPRPVEVSVKDLKAIFVVRDFMGNSRYSDQKKFMDGDKISGKRVEVSFADGEVMIGSTLGYDKNRPGFFLFPADPNSNNIRVFAVSSAIREIRRL